MTATVFDFHGIGVGVSAPDEALAGAIAERFRHFARRDGSTPELSFEYRYATPPQSAARGRTVYEFGPAVVSYAAPEDELVIEVPGHVRQVATLRDGRVETIASPAIRGNTWLLAKPLVTLPLMELLERRGLYGVHAAAVALEGRAVLIAGSSGSGKSTLAVALAREGFDYLGDDLLFLAHDREGRRDEDGPRVRAFPEAADLDGAATALFSELDGLRHGQGAAKRAVDVDEAFGAQVRLTATAAALVFPEVSTETASTLEALDPGETLRRLAPDVLVTDPAATQAHLDALGRLARGVAAHRLRTGRDFGALATRVRALLGA